MYQTLYIRLFSNASRTDRPLVFGLRLFKTYDGGSLTDQEFHEKFIGTVRFGNDHFGAIMGYGDYVVGESIWKLPSESILVMFVIQMVLNYLKGPVALIYTLSSLLETIHVTFDELTEQMAPVQFSSGPAPNLLTPGPISSGLVPNPAPAIPYAPPTNKELEMLFQPMFDEYFNPPTIRQNHIPNVAQDPVIPTGSSVSMAIDLDVPSGSHTSSPLDHHSTSVHHGVAGEQYADHEPFVNVFAPDYNSKASTSGEITIPASNQSTQPH
ncbi:hypothetical protein Tco_0095487, partial [Tanacetum coccineum]